jgi:GTP-binding protein Era
MVIDPSESIKNCLSFFYFQRINFAGIMKSGFVNIFGKPNAGKSTLLNALMGEKLAIVSPKVQTTRHRIKGILNTKEYQVIFSDTPGIIEPKYKLHEKMMQAVKSSLEDADVALLIVDIKDDLVEADEMFAALSLKVPAIVVINKVDLVSQETVDKAIVFFSDKKYCKKVVVISALKNIGIKELLDEILFFVPEGAPFYTDDNLSDLPMKFFVSELIREKIFYLYQEEIPYHSTVLVQQFKEKTTLTKITADIIVQRETQKGIILGHGGQMIKELGTLARKDIEEFIGRKVFLELFVKVRPKWRDNEIHLREYGY